MAVVTMSRKELTRLRVLIDVADGRLSVANAAGLMGVGRRRDRNWNSGAFEVFAARGHFSLGRILVEVTPMKRYLLTLVFLAGCAPIVSDKPVATQSGFNVDQAQCNHCACAPFYGRTGSARPTPGCPEQCRGADGGDCRSRQSQEGLGAGEAQQGGSI
jgi:hypothetical protein